MTSKIERVGAYLRENWVTSPGEPISVIQKNAEGAIFVSGNRGIYVIASHTADLRPLQAQVGADVKITPLLYGDQKIFFRSAQEELVKKLEHPDHTGSLWRYTLLAIEGALLLHKYERIALRIGPINYFHPQSVTKCDTIASYQLEPFVFDYTKYKNLPADKPLRENSVHYHKQKGSDILAPAFTTGSFVITDGKFSEQKREALELRLG